MHGEWDLQGRIGVLANRPPLHPVVFQFSTIAMHCSNVAVAERYGHLLFRGNTVWMEILIKISFSFLFSGGFEIIYYFSSNPVCGYNLAKVKRSTRCKPEKANSDFPQIVHSLDVNCHRKTY